MRVLVTRPEPGASRTARQLEARGHQPILLPLTKVVAVPVSRVPDAFDAVAATSANAIRFAPRPFIAPLERLPLFAVGAETAKAAAAAGFDDIRTGQEGRAGDGSALVEVVIASTRPEAQIVYLCGRVRRADFETRLRKSGRTVSIAETYDTVDVLPDPVAGTTALGNKVDAALAFSPRGAAALAHLMSQPELAERFADTILVCISSRAAEAFSTFDNPVRIADLPQEEALLALL